MKKLLLTLTLASLAVVPLRADIVYSDTFNYADGPIILVGTNLDGTTNWFRHSGTANPSDSIVKNHRLEISASSPGTLPRTDDVHCNFTTFTNTPTILYSSFTVKCTNLPPTTGTYFAHFYVNSTTFQGRVFAQAGSLTNTWRLGVSGVAGTVNKIMPVDLAPNTDYQVVVQWDPVNLFAATLWLNPLSSSDLNFTTSDAVSSPTNLFGYGFRQGGSFGSAFFNISNLVVATTFDEAATNVWSTNAVPPIVISSPSSRTNFVGDQVNLVAVAAGQGITSLNYQWQKNGSDITNPNVNSNVFTIASAAVGDTGDYQLIVTTPFGLSATSAVASLWVTNPPVPPTITAQPQSNNPVFYHQTVTLHLTAIGPPTLTYSWKYNDGPLGPNASGDGTDTLTITDVFTNNSTAGTYRCDVSNPYGTTPSSNAVVTAIGPPAVSIAYLRTLVDPVNYLATNSSLRWQATGTVTTLTNLTTGDTSSYYLQDDTGGINIFVTRGHDFRPPQGSKVTFVGWLSSFNSTLELEADTNDLTTSFLIDTNGDGSAITNPLPAPLVIPFSATNDLAFCETKLEGRTVMLTNVFFGTNAGTSISTLANTTMTVTNANGEGLALIFSSQDLDTAGQTVPDFAWTVVGVFNQNLGNGVTPRNGGYQIEVTRFSDIVTDAPPAVTLSIAHAGNKATLSWPNVAWDNVNRSYGSNYAYTIQAATNIAGPYVPLTTYEAHLLGVNEVPPNGSRATGFGTVAVGEDQTNITVNFRFSGLTVNASAAHIHGPAGAGTNASVLFGFTGVPAATSGAIPEQSFAINATQLGYLQNGLLYMNVHNATFPGGEIRAQILPVSSVGLTFANSAFTNTTPTTATATDINGGGGQKFYRAVSP